MTKKPTALVVVMELLKDRDLTADDLVALSGRTSASVTSALFQLRKDEMLVTTTIPSHRGRPRAIYSLAPVIGRASQRNGVV